MRIIIADTNSTVCDAAAHVGFPHMHRGHILNQPGILVSPANSFGFMDGGIDDVYRRSYPGLEQAVQDSIRQHWGGELPVGSALVVVNPSDHQWQPKHPYVIVAPTMRTPATDLRGSLAPYLAMRAIVRAYKVLAEVEFNSVGSLIPPLVCPGLGTASGLMNPYVALRQMWEATQPVPHFASWREAYNHEQMTLRVGKE